MEALLRGGAAAGATAVYGDQDRFSALHLASFSGQVEAGRLLLSHGAAACPDLALQSVQRALERRLLRLRSSALARLGAAWGGGGRYGGTISTMRTQ